VAGQFTYIEAKAKSAVTLMGNKYLSELCDSYDRLSTEALTSFENGKIEECLKSLDAMAEELSSILESLDVLRLSHD
jgi:hypothetical protein